jgi:hypothetical protein
LKVIILYTPTDTVPVPFAKLQGIDKDEDGGKSEKREERTIKFCEGRHNFSQMSDKVSYHK